MVSDHCKHFHRLPGSTSVRGGAHTDNTATCQYVRQEGEASSPAQLPRLQLWHWAPLRRAPSSIRVKHNGCATRDCAGALGHPRVAIGWQEQAQGMPDVPLAEMVPQVLGGVTPSGPMANV